MILETQRLYLRELTDEDFSELQEILGDRDVMYAYEHAFDQEEIWSWLHLQQMRYTQDGFGLWGVILKESGEFLGQAGLTLQKLEGEDIPEIGYLFKRKHWGKGYATEAAMGCRKYAFETLNLPRVYSIIRNNNFASQRVACRNGMTPVKTIVKHYYGMDMPHTAYCIERQAYCDGSS